MCNIAILKAEHAQRRLGRMHIRLKVINLSLARMELKVINLLLASAPSKLPSIIILYTPILLSLL